jgi:hypothetical protein
VPAGREEDIVVVNALSVPPPLLALVYRNIVLVSLQCVIVYEDRA